MGLQACTVLSNVNHDQKLFEPGHRIDLDAEAAAILIDCGAIKDGYDGDEPAPVDSAKKSTAPTDAAERLAAITATISSFDKENNDLWNRSGAPDVAVISKVLGWTVTAAERNDAWAEMSKV